MNEPVQIVFFEPETVRKLETGFAYAMGGLLFFLFAAVLVAVAALVLLFVCKS